MEISFMRFNWANGARTEITADGRDATDQMWRVEDFDSMGQLKTSYRCHKQELADLALSHSQFSHEVYDLLRNAGS